MEPEEKVLTEPEVGIYDYEEFTTIKESFNWTEIFATLFFLVGLGAGLSQVSKLFL